MLRCVCWMLLNDQNLIAATEAAIAIATHSTIPSMVSPNMGLVSVINAIDRRV